MPIFIPVTLKSNGRTAYINMSKVPSFNEVKYGKGSLIVLEGYDNFEVKESPEEIIEMLQTAASQMGIGR